MSSEKVPEGLIHFLSSKVAYSVTKKTGVPFHKREFPFLRDLALAKITDHFDLFPTLEGLEKYYRERVAAAERRSTRVSGSSSR